LDDLKKVRQHLLYLEQLVNEKALLIVVPSIDARMKAIEIARTGNPKSGFPELSDSLYHALAIQYDAIFITNDSRHVAKVKRFGHVENLADYAKVFEQIV
jgi:predicted nucleic acid-binding protein